MSAPGWRRVTVLSAAVCIAAAPARANEDSLPLIAYSQDRVTAPRYSTWLSSAWSPEAASPSVGREVKWMVARNDPKRNETVVMTLDYDRDINLSRFNGTAWTPNTELCTNTGGINDRMFDACYEQASGELLVVYWNETSKKIGYRTSAGGALSPESSLTLPLPIRVRCIALAPKPGADEVILLAVNELNSLYACVWNGGSFGAVTTLEPAMHSVTNESFAAAYEQVSGHAVVAYAKRNVNRPAYRTWNGTVWSAESLAPSVGSRQLWIRLAAEPASDRVLMVTQDATRDLNVCSWNGSAWGAVLEVENNVQYTNRRQFDVAFAPAGGAAILVYSQHGSNSLRYRTFGGNTWSAEQTGPNVGGRPQVLSARPGENTNEVWIAASTDRMDLAMCLWGGSALGQASIVETDLGGDTVSEQFMLASPEGTGTARPRILRWTHTAP